MPDRSVTVRLRANVNEFNRNIGTSSAAVSTLESRLKSADREGGASIDRLSGRLRVMADMLAIIGPAAVPIGAVAAPAVAALAAQLGFAATGALGFIIAVQGVGDALEALNTARLEPTAENLAAARIAMERLSPAGQDLVQQLSGLRDEWRQLRDVSQDALFPGLSAALDDYEKRLPDLERLLVNVNEAMGDMLADGAESLASPRWDDFFTFIATDAPPALAAMGESLGSVAHAMGELWMAFDPLNDSFATWLVDSTARLDDWAAGLSQTQGFQEFVAYIRESGPQVAETLGAIVLAVVRIGEAAAPLGGPVLAALEGVAEAISAIAQSDAGPSIMATVTALALLSRGTAAFGALQERAWVQGVKGADTFGGKVAAARMPLLRTSAAMGGLALASSGVADGFALSNTATGAMLGMLGGPWGAAVGGAVGLMLDLTNSTDGFKVNADSLTATLNQQTGAITENTAAYAANELEKQGVLAAAQSLGLSLADVTQASLGDADALARVNAELSATSAGFYDANGRIQISTDKFLDFGETSGKVTDAIGTMSGELDAGQSRVRRMADATDEAASAFERGSTAAQDFATAVSRLNDMLAGRAALRDYEAALDDFTKSLEENGRTFDINTEKGRANQAALDNIAGTAIRVAENMRGAARQKFLTSAISDLETMAGRLGVPKEQVRALIRLLEEANQKNVKPKIDVDNRRALASFREVDQWMSNLNGKTATTYVNTVRTVTGPKGAAITSVGADGTTVPKTGMPYADRHPYMLADGEEVVSNRHGQADRHRPLLKAINAGRLADGGTAGDETDAQKKARQAREEARRRAEERRQREEEKRQRQLDKQRTKDLLRSNLRDEQQQANLQLADARRRLKSAKEAGRPKSEILDARLAFKTERTERDDLRAQRREERLEKAAQMQIDAADVAFQAAQDQVDAADRDLKAAETMRDATQQMRDSLDSAVSSQFSGSLTGGGLSGLMGTLNKDINAGSSMSATLQALKDAGLDTTGAAGGLFQELAASNDLKTVNELLAAGPGAIDAAEQAYVQRDQINAARGDMVADAAYGELLAQQTAAVALAQQQLEATQAHAARLESQVEALRAGQSEMAGQFAAALNGVSASVSQMQSKGWASVAKWKQ